MPIPESKNEIWSFSKSNELSGFCSWSLNEECRSIEVARVWETFGLFVRDGLTVSGDGVKMCLLLVGVV